MKKEELEKLEKAVTSDAATAENGPENDSNLNGENAPSIQDTTSPAELEAARQEASEQKTEEVQQETSTEEVEAKTETEAEAEPKLDEVVEAKIPDGVNADQARGGQITEIKFADGLFGDQFSIGSTLKQSPQGNVMENMKAATQDYVENAKNKHNESVTPEDLANQGDLKKD